MSSGKGNSETVNTIRYAPYIEAWHNDLIADLNAAEAVAEGMNPYTGHTDLDFEAGFFGTGYLLSSFPSLYDMFGKFMAGLDVEVLFDEIFADTVNGTAVDDLVSSEAISLEDEIEQNVLPRYEAGMRDINSVMSSTFLVGKALIEANRVKAIEKFSATTRHALIPVATERWKNHLQWNREVIGMYANVLKLYLSQKIDVNDKNFEIAAKEALWPFQIYQYVIQGVGAMSGASTQTEKKPGGGILGTIASIAGMAAMFI